MFIRHSYFQLAMGIRKKQLLSLHLVVACLYREDPSNPPRVQVESSYSNAPWFNLCATYGIFAMGFVSDDVLSGTARRGRWL